MLKSTAASLSRGKGMANDRPTALVLATPQDRHALPAQVRKAAHLAVAWDDQPIFTMSDALADEIATAIDSARQDLAALFLPPDPRTVVEFMTRLATRRNQELPAASDLVADALAVSSMLPADLFDLACQRLWTDFAYRRLPESADFTRAVKDLLDSRTAARTKIERMEKALATRQALKEKSAPRARH